MSLLLDLPKHVEQQMEAYVAAGRFRSSSEVVEAAMGLLNEKMAHEKLRADIAAGAADIAAGRVVQVDFDAIMRDGRAILAARNGQ